MEVEAVALEALAQGSVDVAVRSSFALREAKALAMDADDGVAAVLVVRRRRDDAWIVDVVRFVDEDDVWIDVGSGGGTWGDLPLDGDPEAEPSLGPIATGWCVIGDDVAEGTIQSLIRSGLVKLRSSLGDLSWVTDDQAA